MVSYTISSVVNGYENLVVWIFLVDCVCEHGKACLLLSSDTVISIHEHGFCNLDYLSESSLLSGSTLFPFLFLLSSSNHSLLLGCLSLKVCNSRILALYLLNKSINPCEFVCIEYVTSILICSRLFYCKCWTTIYTVYTIVKRAGWERCSFS